MKIGVLGLQGAYREHMQCLGKLGIDTMDVRYNQDLKHINGLIIPGGESTVISKLAQKNLLFDAIRQKGLLNFPIWGTCAGLILLASEIEDNSVEPLKLMKIKVRRNAFGRQKHSFVTKIKLSGFAAQEEFPGVFIRAPQIISIGDGVEVLARYQKNIVACKQGNLLATSFHPELTSDLLFHQIFLNIVQRSMVTSLAG
ncbi:pyridoxal 5'-phosphate synthase glutaminase subunit PdxT [Desulfallas sp. Bu1-1]|uniref:pyridoxal 5'-phosphate synthase glutaminase subunit PdxT n=1 Tax=Desulfallas sp. Bu1-1 TaxID=2787620 RepID=UPI00189EBFCF|nr:pyridoxal 5'-phosphate synthase glutaminase subunit PdxT [Desulfallas sp. Bu1-1]MBF7082577.1 pyridoxal 5'-phosphate synthase glutaminase subunit PdxT [Desulfallas sp. Bu1-1]